MTSPALSATDDQKTITLEWDERTRCKATIPLDLARELFGLGGTPDTVLEERLTVVAANFTELLFKLGPYTQEERRFEARLQTVNGAPPGGF